jgi:hypothetical protein
MTTTRLSLALFVLGMAGTAPVKAQARPVPSPASATVPDAVAPAFRDAVARVMKAPTVSTRYAEEPFPAHTNVYKWMLDHPDRVSLAWQRLQVACVEITDLGNGKFRWADEAGSELIWQVAGRLADGVIWYATGKVKPAALLPMVPVRAVVVLRHPAGPATRSGAGTLQPDVAAYIQTDSRAANAILRMLGPAIPKMAEQGAEQLLYFFSGVAAYLHKHPDQVGIVLAPKEK